MNNCFSSGSRLKISADFSRVFNDGAVFRTRFFVIFFRYRTDTQPRLGIAVSKKCLPLAVRRNQVKRWQRELFRTSAPRLPAVDLVLVGRQSIRKIGTAQLRAELENAWEGLIRHLAK